MLMFFRKMAITVVFTKELLMSQRHLSFNSVIKLVVMSRLMFLPDKKGQAVLDIRYFSLLIALDEHGIIINLKLASLYC